MLKTSLNIKGAFKSLHIIHWTIILLSFCLTIFAWSYSKKQVEEKFQLQFDRQANQIVRLVVDRMQNYVDALWGGVSYIYADGYNVKGALVPYNNWKKYIDNLNIIEKYPGINGIGVVYYVSPLDLESFLENARKELAEFQIHPKHDNNVYLPITYIIPVKENEKAVGLDMAFESNRFTAAIKSKDTGEAQMTGPIVLVQDKEKTPGFLLFVPFYTNPQEKGKGNFLGMVYAPFIMKQLMDGALLQAHRDIVIRISDKETILFDELIENKSLHEVESKHKKKVVIEIYGRNWTFDLWSSSSFTDARTISEPNLILLAGLIIEILLVILFLHMARTKYIAMEHAKYLNHDIEKKAKELSTLNKRLKLALSASNVGVWEYDLDSRTLIWDSAMHTLYCTNKEDFSGQYKDWINLIHPEDRKDTERALSEAIEGRGKVNCSFRVTITDGKNRVIKSLADVVYDNGAPKKIIGVNWEITDIKEKEAQLEYLANHDALSRLKNRFNFNDVCRKAINRVSRSGRKFALLLVDLDDFKQINDLYGHQVGDKYIRIVSEILQNVCRDSDLVFRLVGDEFAILTGHIDDGAIASDIAERVISALSASIMIDDFSVNSSCSIGIGVYPYAGSTVDELMKNADIALYKSKAQGKGCINFFTDSLNEKAKLIRFIKNNLVNAIKNDEIFINYQPIVDMRYKKTLAVEALARWNSTIGAIPPYEFVAIAEKDNTIHILGEAIIKQIAKDMSKKSCMVSINCSSKQLLEQSDFSELLINSLEDSDLAPERVILEITETYLIRDFKRINKTLNDVHKYGVDIAIDDFGTGYASLSLLANIPFQYLKIDRTFIQNMNTESGYKVLQCIYNVACSLNKKIIAEGVETEEQETKLLNMGITLVQGYYYSKPTDIKDIKIDF